MSRLYAGRGWISAAQGKKNLCPLCLKAGNFAAGDVSVDGSLSSQFISALLIALPSLKSDSRLVLTGKEMVSQDYIQMTIEILAKAGIVIKRLSQREYEIKGGQKFKGLKNFYVPSDYGLAAFVLGAALFCLLMLFCKGIWMKV